MNKRNALYPLWHALALLAGFFRRPGRFAVSHYPREKALQLLKAAQNGVVLDVGCGRRKLSEHVIAIDLFPKVNVDIAADATQLPFRDASCDGLWLEALLEHVEDPKRVLDEAVRVLKSGGWLYAEIPFLQGEHAAPGDYQRWTRSGLTRLFDDWEIEWLEMSSGPFSALAYQLRCCLSILTSFGSDFLYRLLFEALWGYVVWPLQWLDFIFKNHPRAAGHAFGYAVMVRKKF